MQLCPAEKEKTTMGPSSKTEVVLINPQIYNLRYAPGGDNAWPLGVLAIGSVLKQKGYSVTVMDYHLQEDVKPLRQCIGPNTLFVGLSVMTPQLKQAVSISGQIRGFSPETPIVWGGVHPSLEPEQVLNERHADYAVVGSGYGTAAALADALRDGTSCEDIDGLAWRNGSGVRINPDVPSKTNLETLPAIDYDLSSSREHYVNRALDWTGRQPTNYRKSYSVHSGIGCPHRCSFCVCTIIFKRRYYFKSAYRILEECQHYVDRFGANHIFFRDDNFFGNRRRLLEFLELYLERGCNFTWDASCRADYFRDNYINAEVTDKLRRTNCLLLNLGVESGSRRIRQMIRKDVEEEDVFRAAETMKKAGIISSYSFITNLPTETPEEKRETQALITRIRQAAGPHWIIGPQPYRPYPGCELFDVAMENFGLKKPQSVSQWIELMDRNIWFDRN